MAKLAETQNACDKKKYLESEKAGFDRSGLMDYCMVCSHCTNKFGCDIPHEKRVETSECARAYKRLHRTK